MFSKTMPDEFLLVQYVQYNHLSLTFTKIRNKTFDRRSLLCAEIFIQNVLVCKLLNSFSPFHLLQYSMRTQQ